MVHLRHRNLLQTMAATIFPPFYRRRAETIFLPFYRHRAARKQYFCVLSSPCGAGTIFLPFYRHRAARERYFCCFIVAVRRGNDIFAVLSSPCSAGTILLPFYRHRAARERYFRCFSACSAPANTFPNGFGACRPTASVQKCGENRAGMAAGLMQRGK